MIGDKDVGAYLTLCPEYSFVCENSLDGSVVGFACAAPDAKTLFTRYNVAWLPEMRLKYPRQKGAKADLGAHGAAVDEDMLTPMERLAHSFHAENSECVMPEFCTTRLPPPLASVTEAMSAGSNAQPASIPTPVAAAAAAALSAEAAAQPWGVAHMRIAPSALSEVSLSKRLTMLVLASLRASGTFRLFVEADNPSRRDFYSGMGFIPMGPVPSQPTQLLTATPAPAAVVVAAPAAADPSPAPGAAAQPIAPLPVTPEAALAFSSPIYMSRSF